VSTIIYANSQAVHQFHPKPAPDEREADSETLNRCRPSLRREWAFLQRR
jgi:hypothetical protein